MESDSDFEAIVKNNTQTRAELAQSNYKDRLYSQNQSCVHLQHQKQLNKIKLVPINQSAEKSIFRLETYKAIDIANQTNTSNFGKIRKSFKTQEKTTRQQQKIKSKYRVNTSLDFPKQFKPTSSNPETYLLKNANKNDLLWESPDFPKQEATIRKVYKIKRPILKGCSKRSSEGLIQKLSESYRIKTCLDHQGSQSGEILYLYELQKDQIRRKKAAKTFRKLGNIVLFTIYLRRFNERMRVYRRYFFNKFHKGEVRQQLVELKRHIILYLQPLVTTFVNNNTDLCPHRKDDIVLFQEKSKLARKITKYTLEIFKNCMQDIQGKSAIIQVIYHLCKHGSFSCEEPWHTREQLNLMCVSQHFGYVSADKNLQSSSLISLIIVKILIYNILLEPALLSSKLYKKDCSNMDKNLKLIGNILYQLAIQLQDQFLNSLKHLYHIGNWNPLSSKYKFSTAESMTVKEGFYDKNQLISGLLPHKFVMQYFSVHTMVEAKQILKQIIEVIRQYIAQYHRKISNKTF